MHMTTCQEHDSKIAQPIGRRKASAMERSLLKARQQLEGLDGRIERLRTLGDGPCVAAQPSSEKD